jgi:hypothetical protein
LGGQTDAVPGGTPTVTKVVLTNVGGIETTGASLVLGDCDVTPAGDNVGDTGSDTAGFCGKVDVTIANTTSGAADKCVFPTVTTAACSAPSSTGTLAGLSDQTLNSPGLSVLAAGASATYVITVQLDASATNADQYLSLSLPFTWAITQ